ncbi:peroxisomal fatty acid beta-oxidation multifunctional protein AIM1-like [Salvia splendens]|uniref:peroxisomal fatty acid beta-oxidation multifunctional protein AIM1-like n=1 Tax=Salvia splendens TaxID=180675 RepID=UPI001C26BE83|nr:peroxisomal fatty acid beta-oxidation multifunctional protein AIM1-like [Salvia splendens]
MRQPTVTMEVGHDGVAIITISNPPVNALALTIFDGLKDKYGEAMRRDDVKAVVLTGDAGKFSGGFDINVFERVHRTGDISNLPETSISVAVNLIEDGKKPTVAALQGLALGGGLELALASHARIAAPNTLLGLPELTLGVIPGSGGTQRLPRLIGLPKALELMLFSKSITSEEGKDLGLVDAVVPSDELLKASRQWALDIIERRKPWIRSLHWIDKLGSLPEVVAIIKTARQQAKQSFKNLPQHQACLDVIEEGIIHGGYHGILKESRVFKDLISTDTSKGLVHAFFSQRATSKVPNVTDIGLKPRKIMKVAVIGGGLMGSGIATSLILSDIYVILKEINSEYLLKGIKAIEGNVRGLVSRKKLAKDKAEKALLMVKGTLDYSDFKDVDMVIEAVVENIPLKQKIFADIEKACPPHCILASNTSTIDLNIIGEKTKSQDRIIGAHFFSPAHVMPLLEIVRTEKTSAQVILDLMTVGKIIKKVPVVVGNCTGFAVNRAFFPYSQSAHLLLHLGVDIFRIDQLISNFGLPLGPFQLQDVAGYGVVVATTEIFRVSFPDRTFQSPLVPLLLKNGRNGKNNGKGYYIYEKGSKPKPDPSVLPIIEESRRTINIMPGGKPISVTDDEIVQMILFPVVNEACRVFDEGVVVRASDLDTASILGMSFPSYRGGIIFWADTIGADHIYKSLQKWYKLYGNFFKPSRFLEERATRGIPLSAPTTTSSTAKARL